MRGYKMSPRRSGRRGPSLRGSMPLLLSLENIARSRPSSQSKYGVFDDGLCDLRALNEFQRTLFFLSLTIFVWFLLFFCSPMPLWCHVRQIAILLLHFVSSILSYYILYIFVHFVHVTVYITKDHQGQQPPEPLPVHLYYASTSVQMRRGGTLFKPQY